MEISHQHEASAALIPRKKPRTHYMRLSESSRSQFGRCGDDKNFVHLPGLETWNQEPESLNWLHYPAVHITSKIQLSCSKEVHHQRIPHRRNPFLWDEASLRTYVSLKTRANPSFETPRTEYPAKWCCVPQEQNLQQHFSNLGPWYNFASLAAFLYIKDYYNKQTHYVYKTFWAWSCRTAPSSPHLYSYSYLCLLILHGFGFLPFNPYRTNVENRVSS